MVKLFVGGFPLDMTELELVQMVSPFADVSTIKIVRDKKTRICKGYAFLEVTEEIDALNAINELNGTQMKDRELLLNIVPDKPAPAPNSRPNQFRKPNPSYNTNSRPGSNYSRPPSPSSSSAPSSTDPERKKRPRKTN